MEVGSWGVVGWGVEGGGGVGGLGCGRWGGGGVLGGCGGGLIGGEKEVFGVVEERVYGIKWEGEGRFGSLREYYVRVLMKKCFGELDRGGFVGGLRGWLWGSIGGDNEVGWCGKGFEGGLMGVWRVVKGCVGELRIGVKGFGVEMGLIVGGRELWWGRHKDLQRSCTSRKSVAPARNRILVYPDSDEEDEEYSSLPPLLLCFQTPQPCAIIKSVHHNSHNEVDIDNMTLEEYTRHELAMSRAKNLRKMEHEIPNRCDDITDYVDYDQEDGELHDLPTFSTTNEFASVCEQEALQWSLAKDPFLVCMELNDQANFMQRITLLSISNKWLLEYIKLQRNLELLGAKGRSVWSLKFFSRTAWSWRSIMKLRDKIKDFIGYKIGNGKSCFIWFDKWHSNGPLCKLIIHSLLNYYGLDAKDKIIDWIENGEWSWPNDWIGRFKDVLDVPVPVLNELEDKVVWYNKKNKVVNFSVKEACIAFRVDMPDVLYLIWDSIKVMAKLDSLSNIWAEVVSGEKNIRIFDNNYRTVDAVLNLIINTVRLKLNLWYGSNGDSTAYGQVVYGTYGVVKGPIAIVHLFNFSLVFNLHWSLVLDIRICSLCSLFLDDSSSCGWYRKGMELEVKSWSKYLIFEELDVRKFFASFGGLKNIKRISYLKSWLATLFVLSGIRILRRSS
ncbi:hypothetical protein Tco_1571466 [Tanacetum coccineum]